MKWPLSVCSMREIHYRLHQQLPTSHFSALQTTELRGAMCQATWLEHCKELCRIFPRGVDRGPNINHLLCDVKQDFTMWCYSVSARRSLESVSSRCVFWVTVSDDRQHFLPLQQSEAKKYLWHKYLLLKWWSPLVVWLRFPGSSAAYRAH